MRSQDGQEAFVSIALMQEQRLSQFAGQLDLGREAALLLGARREIPIEVQAALADGHDLRLTGQVAELRQGTPGPVTGVVRMQPCRGRHGAGMSTREGEAILAALGRGAGVDQANHASGHGAAEDGLAIRLERAVRQFHPDTRRELAVHWRVRMRLRGLVPGHD
jgi:hypothetical protein